MIVRVSRVVDGEDVGVGLGCVGGRKIWFGHGWWR